MHNLFWVIGYGCLFSNGANMQGINSNKRGEVGGLMAEG